MRRLALPGAVLLALAVVFVVSWATLPASGQATAQASRQVAVTSVTRSCPPSAPGAGTASISMVGLSARSAAGTATFSEIPATPASGNGSAAAGKKSKPITVSTPGTATTVRSPGHGGTAVSATGAMAEGFEAEQTDASGTGLVSCTHPGSDMWFVGTGQAAGASAVWLYLMNTGNITASADVTILTDTGTQNGLSSAITIAPNQSVAQNITPYVRGSQALALHVQTNTGQVAASAWEGSGSGGAWLPQTSAPSTSLVIPGLTVASSAARLFVMVPGSTDAQLKV
ncbi:MAG: DUF5719 family protein, partial [Trebonia sp.]